MSLINGIAREDRVDVRYSSFHSIVKQAAQFEIMMNGVNCNIPHKYLREMMTGKSECSQPIAIEGTK